VSDFILSSCHFVILSPCQALSAENAVLGWAGRVVGGGDAQRIKARIGEQALDLCS
jgi:hypothetical protein